MQENVLGVARRRVLRQALAARWTGMNKRVFKVLQAEAAEGSALEEALAGGIHMRADDAAKRKPRRPSPPTPRRSRSRVVARRFAAISSSAQTGVAFPNFPTSSPRSSPRRP